MHVVATGTQHSYGITVYGATVDVYYIAKVVVVGPYNAYALSLSFTPYDLPLAPYVSLLPILCCGHKPHYNESVLRRKL